MSSSRPLVALLLLMPLWTAFLVADSVIVGRWRRRLLDAWCADALQLAVFAHASRDLPYLPRQTLDGMLATLPILDDEVAERHLSRTARRVLRALADDQRESEILLSVTAAGTASVAAVSALAAVWSHTAAPLAAVTLVVPLLGLSLVWSRASLRRRIAVIAASHPDVTVGDLPALAAAARNLAGGARNRRREHLSTALQRLLGDAASGAKAP